MRLTFDFSVIYYDLRVIEREQRKMAEFMPFGLIKNNQTKRFIRNHE